MESRWKHIADRGGDYPEAFLLNVDEGKIKIEVNRDKKAVSILVETPQGEAYQSTITNGVVLEECELPGRTAGDFRLEFEAYSGLISSLPDHKVLRIVGSNYGVMSEFIGKVVKTAGEDVLLIKSYLRALSRLPARCLARLKRSLRVFLERPGIWDIFDISVVLGAGYLSYLWNFSYLFGGFMLMGGAVASGYADLLLRRKAPYVIKVVGIFFPALFIAVTGWRIQ